MESWHQTLWDLQPLPTLTWNENIKKNHLCSLPAAQGELEFFILFVISQIPPFSWGCLLRQVTIFHFSAQSVATTLTLNTKQWTLCNGYKWLPQMHSDSHELNQHHQKVFFFLPLFYCFFYQFLICWASSSSLMERQHSCAIVAHFSLRPWGSVGPHSYQHSLRTHPAISWIFNILATLNFCRNFHG